MSSNPSPVTPDALPPNLAQLAAQAEQEFGIQFGGKPSWIIASPGRVNLIGEHVDYNDGFVLPMAIERHFVLAAAPGTTGWVARVHSTAKGETVGIPLDRDIARAEPAWANYVRGVMAGFRARHPLATGFDVVITGDLPLGGGLSSSAALEVGTCLLLETITGHALGNVDRALLCQQAEHKFAGVPCGIMDQFVVIHGEQDHTLLLDCRSMKFRQVHFDDPSVTILITHSGVAHELGKGEYAKRRAQCHKAADIIGVKSLRDARMDHLSLHARRMGAEELRRARHVISEIQRAQDFAEAAERRDWHRAGQLMYQSHFSLRDDYEVSCAELDALVRAAQELGEPGGVYGARLTGGGFGGCTVTLTATDRAEAAAQHLLESYQRKTGLTAKVFASRPAQGARRIW